ncbi:MAG: glyoxalase/bleomycin resistance/extradiol dioxygenase family protein [Sandaracinus sp.]|nr:glyoxalase/bleomycin resistance/extradiol dioxygenase family protein [Sandaracinus sp.]MCB9622506.1 glyoxalase/bleomycin resistance/extradiol dioxygenase family protein [Sandaracinus sp.]
MTRSRSRELFLNLPVSDLPAAMRFFAALGFAYDPRFTNDQAACMIVSDKAYVMLLQKPFFETFTPRALCDTSRAIEGLFAFDAESRAAVDAVLEAAVAAGGAEARGATDHGFMYARSFFDLDGHQWEVLWMDEAAFLASKGVAS